MIGWKVAKDRPIRSLDVNAWKRNVIDIDKKAASLKEYQSPEDNDYDDNTSMGSIDVDDDSNEGEKQKYNSEPGDQTLQRKKKMKALTKKMKTMTTMNRAIAAVEKMSKRRVKMNHMMMTVLNHAVLTVIRSLLLLMVVMVCSRQLTLVVSQMIMT